LFPRFRRSRMCLAPPAKPFDEPFKRMFLPSMPSSVSFFFFFFYLIKIKAQAVEAGTPSIRVWIQGILSFFFFWHLPRKSKTLPCSIAQETVGRGVELESPFECFFFFVHFLVSNFCWWFSFPMCPEVFPSPIGLPLIVWRKGLLFRIPQLPRFRLPRSPNLLNVKVSGAEIPFFLSLSALQNLRALTL